MAAMTAVNHLCLSQVSEMIEKHAIIKRTHYIYKCLYTHTYTKYI